MTTILSWNIQCGKGVDGKVDLGRIATRIRTGGAPDVICLQEVAVGFPEYDGGAGADQPEQVAQLFREYRAIFRPALEWLDGIKPRRFGNMILSRLPVLEAQSHILPRPADRVLHMPRQALEVVVQAAFGPLRVVTTHLEFHSLRQRAAQVERIRELEAEWAANTATPPATGKGSYAGRPAPLGSVWCGDFNFPVEEASYHRMQDGGGLVDAWPLLKPGELHVPTCGVFDAVQWPQGPHARDFFFVSKALTARVRAIDTDVETDASDHQPIRLSLID